MLAGGMSADAPAPREALAALRAGLDDVMLRDARRLGRRLDGVRGIRDPRRQAGAIEQIERDVAAARSRLLVRQAALPVVSYPEQLPVSARREDIAAAIRDHQVVVVAGETGSGKTTQLPKICLELGRGVRGQIGHTQPRRIAARSVAERIAEELAVPLGDAVGYKVRFTDRASDSTLVKVMTDGILLAEMQGDRLLSGYDTIIIDEAHERSLNIDFILGYLKQLLPRRPDLKVVITSATIDPQRFSAHFGGAPVVEVSGRTYPVEVRYRPLVQPAVLDEDDDLDDLERPSGRRNPLLAKQKAAVETDVVRDQVEAVCEAVTELAAEGPGDVLVFLSGEREIRDAAEALNRLQLRHTEVLPLYARLSAAEQHRVFTAHTGRRVVLATNVAETSLTVPGIKYVVDPGTARISRYSNRLKVQRLPIEPVSQASANQRAGRCGRTSDGICIRLYDEEDYLARPEFTEPEILRTNLASVILQMTALGLGDVERFPFVDPPDKRSVKDGVDLLVELGALDPSKPAAERLTDVGRRLARLPVDPRLGRMILEAHRNGCVREVMVVAAALSIQDVRERPVDAQQQADEKHRRFADESSDFVTLLNLWEYLREQQKALSGSAFRRLCRSEYLNYLRVREWQDLYVQLRQLAKELDVTLNAEPADPQRVHQSLLAGLLSHVGLRDVATRDYAGARGARFAVFPGSALAKKQPSWLMAAELVETSRLWARTVARIEPESRYLGDAHRAHEVVAHAGGAAGRHTASALHAAVELVQLFREVGVHRLLDARAVDVLVLRVQPRLEPLAHPAHPLAGVDGKIADQLEHGQRRERDVGPHVLGERAAGKRRPAVDHHPAAAANAGAAHEVELQAGIEALADLVQRHEERHAVRLLDLVGLHVRHVAWRLRVVAQHVQADLLAVLRGLRAILLGVHAENLSSMRSLRPRSPSGSSVS